MVEELQEAGNSHGYMTDGGLVWIRGPGSPWTDTPANYSPAELNAAIASGKLEKQEMTGSSDFTY
jgi:hypothetical protein